MSKCQKLAAFCILYNVNVLVLLTYLPRSQMLFSLAAEFLGGSGWKMFNGVGSNASRGGDMGSYGARARRG